MPNIVAILQDKITAMLAAKGVSHQFGPDDPLFTEGLLDSLAATEIMMMLETDYGVDTAADNFDIMRIDTIAGMAALVAEATEVA